MLAASTDAALLANDTGRRILPEIVVPEDAVGISILNDGTVEVRVPGDTDTQQIGQFETATFVNPTGLEAIGGNLYRETVASGAPQIDTPGTNGAGTLIQGSLESSNVNVVAELVSMIETQRAYELNSRAVATSDEMLQYLTNNI